MFRRKHSERDRLFVVCISRRYTRSLRKYKYATVMPLFMCMFLNRCCAHSVIINSRMLHYTCLTTEINPFAHFNKSYIRNPPVHYSINKAFPNRDIEWKKKIEWRYEEKKLREIQTMRKKNFHARLSLTIAEEERHFFTTVTCHWQQIIIQYVVEIKSIKYHTNHS